MRAVEAAKKLIHNYVFRGDTVEEISRANMGVAFGYMSAHVGKGKIVVTGLNNKPLIPHREFTVAKIFNLVTQEPGYEESVMKHRAERRAYNKLLAYFNQHDMSADSDLYKIAYNKQQYFSCNYMWPVKDKLVMFVSSKEGVWPYPLNTMFSAYTGGQLYYGTYMLVEDWTLPFFKVPIKIFDEKFNYVGDYINQNVSPAIYC